MSNVTAVEDVLSPSTSQSGVAGVSGHYMRRQAASRYLLSVWGIERAPSTLAKLACHGGGPRYVKAGRTPMYRAETLDEWARELLGENPEDPCASRAAGRRARRTAETWSSERKR